MGAAPRSVGDAGFGDGFQWRPDMFSAWPHLTISNVMALVSVAAHHVVRKRNKSDMVLGFGLWRH